MNTLRVSILSVITLFISLIAGPTLRAQQSFVPDSTLAHASRVPGVVYAQFRSGYLPQWIPTNSPGIFGHNDPVLKIFGEIGVDSIKQFDPVASKDPISHRLGIDQIYDIYYSSDAAPLGVVVRLLQTGLVETASPRYIFQPQHVPDDPGVGSEYWIQNVQAEPAWDITMGDSNVIIADVDEGVDVTHEDLKGNIKFNPGETATNGKDNDGDGYPNDWEGWNTALNNNIVTPPPCDASVCEGNHGTETTGCFGAVADNGIGVAGMAPKCKILVVRISDNNGQLTGAYEGLHYAAVFCGKYAKHAVINNSWGGETDPVALSFASIFPQEITARGQVCVASAGNYAMDNDVTPFYPACVPGVLSVGATDEKDNPTSFTHYGHVVSVFAPGIDIYTTNTQSPENNDGYTDLPGVAGTSFSGPIVAGLAGLLFSYDSSLTPDAVKNRIIQTCDPIPNKDPYLYHGRINAFAALNIPPTPALSVQDYSIGSTYLGTLGAIGSSNALNVNFINLGPDGSHLSVTIQPGAGYTWQGYNPQYPALWPMDPIGIIYKKDSATTGFQIIRTGQFSEGSILVNFLLNYGTSTDSAQVRVPLTPQAGMTHRLLVQHATCVRQMDATNGWAGFGYSLSYYDPERNADSSILVSQYSVRSDTGWSFPDDIPGGEPIYSMDAIDKDHVWFAGNSSIYATSDGGTPSALSTPGVTIRSLHFADAENGMLIGDASGGKWNILTTANGGQDWTPSSFAPSAGTATRSFYNSASWVGQRIWFGTDAGIFYSTNGGKNWVDAPLTGATKTQKNVMAVAFASDSTLGYAAVTPFGQNADSAGLFVSTGHGVQWSLYTGLQYHPGFIPYSIAFIPGTDTAIITANQGIFKLASSTYPKDSLIYISAPTSFNPISSQVSVGGTSGALTISAASDPSGIADYTIGSAGVPQEPSITNSFGLETRPNPLSEQAELSFTLPRAGRIRIAMIDALGRTVANIYDGALSGGPHTLPLVATNLANGTYYCTLETETGERAVTRVIIAR